MWAQAHISESNDICSFPQGDQGEEEYSGHTGIALEDIRINNDLASRSIQQDL